MIAFVNCKVDCTLISNGGLVDDYFFYKMTPNFLACVEKIGEPGNKARSFLCTSDPCIMLAMDLFYVQ